MIFHDFGVPHHRGGCWGQGGGDPQGVYPILEGGDGNAPISRLEAAGEAARWLRAGFQRPKGRKKEPRGELAVSALGPPPPILVQGVAPGRLQRGSQGPGISTTPS